jgi:hypothetical protein
MSTQPTAPPPQPPKRIRLGPIAAALAVTLIIAFGLCLTNFKLEGDDPPIVNIAIGVEIACIVGLLALMIIALSRRGTPR